MTRELRETGPSQIGRPADATSRIGNRPPSMRVRARGGGKGTTFKSRMAHPITQGRGAHRGASPSGERHDEIPTEGSDQVGVGLGGWARDAGYGRDGLLAAQEVAVPCSAIPRATSRGRLWCV